MYRGTKGMYEIGSSRIMWQACRADRRAREEEARVMHATLTELQLPPANLQWLHKATEHR